MNVRQWYKIVEVDDKGQYKTLFHGVKGSRILKLNEWVEAEVKDVSDGSSGTTYKSGWHLLPTYEECAEYLEKMFKHKHNKVIVKCRAKEVWKKSHSRNNVYLARYILIEGDADDSSKER